MTHQPGIRVQLFGPYADAHGGAVLLVDAPEPTTAGEIIERIRAASPSLATLLPSARLAVNHRFARADDPVRSGDEVALIGLVGGG